MSAAPGRVSVGLPVDREPAPPPRAGVARGLLRAARPRQWVKNLLVVAAPAAAGVLGRPGEVARTAAGVLAFTLAAAGCYLVNDALDAAADRLHPVKRHRPLASGAVTPAVALVASAGCLVAAGLLAVLVAGWALLGVLAIYVTLTTAYSVRLKRVVIVELLVVASGFVLRAGAGAAATGVPVSEWFLIVTSFGALFVVLGKRCAEVQALGSGAGEHRAVLAEYPAGYLRQIRDLTAAVTLLAYCLWAFERASTVHAGLPFYQLSIVPVTFGLLRYSLLVERGEGGAPEEVLLRDRPILATAIVWAVLFGLGVAHL